MNESNEFSMDMRSIKQWRTGIKVAAYLVYLAGGLFSAIIFSQHIASQFPTDPIMRAMAFAGGWANFLSLAIMPLAKERWVSGTSMTIAAWVFWAFEFMAVVLNVLAAYQSPWATWWTSISPASPVLVIAIWGLLFYLNPESKVHQAQVDFYIDAQADFRAKMARAMKSQRVQDVLNEGAAKAAAQYAEKSLGVVIDPTHGQPPKQSGRPMSEEVKRKISETMRAKMNPAVERVQPGENGNNNHPLA